MIEVKTINGKPYKIANGTFYNNGTPDEVIKILEDSRINKKRIRIFLGDTKTGKDWTESYDTIGRIGRSCGEIKIPILIKNRQSLGGGAILDHCIVKITINKEVVYQHPEYHLPEFEVKEADEALKEKGYFYSVLADGRYDFNCKTKEKAEKWIAFLRGFRNNFA